MPSRAIPACDTDPDGSGNAAWETYYVTVLRPLTAAFVKSSAGPRFAMYFTVTPVSELRSIAWTYVALEYGEQTDEQIRDFANLITWQDVPVVETQHPELLPLDLQP